MCCLGLHAECLLCAIDSILSPRMVTYFRKDLPRENCVPLPGCDRQDLSDIYGISRPCLPLCREEPGGLAKHPELPLYPRSKWIAVGAEQPISWGPSPGSLELLLWHSSCHILIPQFPNLGGQHSPAHPFTPCFQDASFQTGLWADREHVCRFSTAILVHSDCEFSPKAHLPGFRSTRACEKGISEDFV